MAGLIQQQMAGQAPVDAQQEEAAMQSVEQNDDAEPNEQDPNYQAALELAMKTLYQDGAAKDVATQLKAAGDKVSGLSDVAYEITSVVDERTQGAIPDELLVAFAMKVLEEVVEIADAAGLDPQPEEVAQAFQQMILRYLNENGVDTAQLQQAMSQVDPAVFREAAEQE